jgi:NAD(P)-dependent dehydrogenase (short-subunit alcohol dehydrogenase family)
VIRVARTLSPADIPPFHDRTCDVSDPEAVAQLAEQVLAQLGVPDILVNNAGTFDRIPFDAADPAEFARQLGVNLVGPFAVARGFLPAMRQRGSGLLITIGSVADHVAFPGNTAYSATKFGLRGLHETLAAEYKGSGVRCSLVSPGPTDTPIWDPVAPERLGGVLPRGKMLRPEDVADAILFVATRPSHVSVEWLQLMPAPLTQEVGRAR